MKGMKRSFKSQISKNQKIKISRQVRHKLIKFQSSLQFKLGKNVRNCSLSNFRLKFPIWTFKRLQLYVFSYPSTCSKLILKIWRLTREYFSNIKCLPDADFLSGKSLKVCLVHLGDISLFPYTLENYTFLLTSMSSVANLWLLLDKDEIFPSTADLFEISHVLATTPVPAV